jgi:general secretion pathway protein F
MMSFAPALLLLVLVVGFFWADAPGGRSGTLYHFARYLASVVSRNLPLGSSLSAYAHDLPAACFTARRAILEVADACDNGFLLADALDRCPGTFPPAFRAVVRAGEKGGNLGPVLQRLAEFIDFDTRIVRRAAGLALYPAVLSGAVITGYSVVITLVVPQFTQMCDELSQTRVVTEGLYVMLFAGHDGTHVISAIFWGVVLLALGGRALRGSAPFGRASSWVAWHIPPLRRFERRRATAQYTVALSRLLEAGVPYHEAVATAASASGNLHFDAMARRASELTAEGRQLSRALREADVRGEVPAEILWYLEIGERSGRMTEALDRAAAASSARSHTYLTGLVDLVFPVGVGFVGVAVGLLGYFMFSMLAHIAEAL